MLLAVGAASADFDAQVLRPTPICETSGIAFQPCPGSDDRCVLIADNERKGELYRFEVDGTELKKQWPVRLSRPGATLKKASIKDAEGLAVTGKRVIVLGSHSRRSAENGCTLDEDRLVYAAFEPSGPDGLVGDPIRIPLDKWTKALGEGGDCFLTPGEKGRALAATVCKAMIEGGAHAEDDPEKTCGAAVNFEGIAIVPNEQVWFGLRGPTVKSGAVLLRLKRIGEVGFDAVATVALEGNGVRDLLADGKWLWILAGPSADAQEKHSLWRVPLADVVDGAELQPKRIVEGLPPFSEGFAIDPETHGAFVVVDGDEGKGPECKEPARYLYLKPELLD